MRVTKSVLLSPVFFPFINNTGLNNLSGMAGSSPSLKGERCMRMKSHDALFLKRKGSLFYYASGFGFSSSFHSIHE